MGRTGKLSRRVAVWSSLTAGLLMASAPAVLAADPASKTREGGSRAGHGAAAKGQATPAEKRAPASDSPPESPNAGPGADNAAGAGENKPNAGENKPNGDENKPNAGENKPNAGENKPNAGEKPSRAETAGQRTSRGGPSGNNGTVKIDGVPFDTHPNNQPHVDCRFQVDFYGFDEGDLYATVGFALQSPTTDGRLEVTSGGTRVFIGEDDNSGGGSVRGLDAEETYTLDFPGVTPHPKQGYHVKVTVHADGSRGADTKHKVFWVKPCGTTTALPANQHGAPGNPNPDSPTNPASQPGAVGGTEQVHNEGQAGAHGNPNPNGSEVLGVTLERSAPAGVAGTEQARVAGTEQARLTASPPAAGTNADNRTRVLGTTLERSALARTGLHLFEVTTLGVLLLLAGYAAVRASRRKTGHSAESAA